jgi:outer membrane protein assembly factor BamD (BamD/ComL family)
MSGLARAVTWTQRVGYSYPASTFQAAVKATFPRLTDTEVRHCLAEYERCVGEWYRRVEAERASYGYHEPRARA